MANQPYEMMPNIPDWTKIGPGCGLERREHGRYTIRFSRKGRKKGKTLETTDYALAVTQARKYYERWNRGEYDPWLDRDRFTGVDQACRHYQKERGEELRDKGRENVWALKQVCKKAKIEFIQALTPDIIRRAVYDPTLAEATQYSKYTKIRAILEWMTAAGYFDRNPASEVKKPSPPKRHPKYFSAVEQERFIRALPEVYQLQKYARKYRYPLWYADALLFYLYTGVRRGEGPRVCWGDVVFPDELTRGFIRVRDTKKKKDRIVPILPPALSLLKRLESEWRLSDNPHETVLKNHTGANPISGRYLSRKFNQARELARVPAIGLHGLRHTFAMMLIERGVPLPAIKEILGHDDITTTQVYTTMMPADILDSVARAFE